MFFLSLSLFFAQVGSSEAPPIQLSASIRPIELILNELVTEDFEVHRIAPPGSSPHHFEPTPSTIREATQSAKIFYASRHLDQWVTRVATGVPRVELIEALSSESRLMTEEHHHDHSHGHSHSHDHSHSHGKRHSHRKIVDPHFWMDPQTVQQTLPLIENQLCKLHAASCEQVQQRRKRFEESLNALHEEVSAALEAHRGRPIITTHDFLAYFSRTYGLDYQKPIEPIPGKEPSPRDLARLIRLVQEKNLQVIYNEPQLSAQAVETIAREAGIRVEMIDPVGVDTTKIASYEDLIRFNLRQILLGFQE